MYEYTLEPLITKLVKVCSEAWPTDPLLIQFSVIIMFSGWLV